MACFNDPRAPAAPTVFHPLGASACPACPPGAAPPPVARWSRGVDGRPIRRWSLPAHTHR